MIRGIFGRICLLFSMKGYAMDLKSNKFAHNSPIPDSYTCQGKDISPPISWSNIPKNAKSLVLIVYDPDAPDPKAPKMTWVHWVLYNLPVNCKGLAENVQDLPEGTKEGLSDWKTTGYGGPCPPIGEHRYFFKLYALDIILPDLNKPTKQRLEQAMAGHIIEQAELIGKYKKK